MFLVYNEETGRFQTGRQYPTMILVSLSAVDEDKVKLEAVGMPSVVFNVPKCAEGSSEAVQCTMWWGEPVTCIDCGPQAAEWLSRYAEMQSRLGSLGIRGIVCDAADEGRQ